MCEKYQHLLPQDAIFDDSLFHYIRLQRLARYLTALDLYSFDLDGMAYTRADLLTYTGHGGHRILNRGYS